MSHTSSNYDWPEGLSDQWIAELEAMAAIVDRHGGKTCDVRAVVVALFAANYRRPPPSSVGSITLPRIGGGAAEQRA